ncbi:hypothetical protein GBF38_008513, partial [Nibea albiflora]
RLEEPISGRPYDVSSLNPAEVTPAPAPHQKSPSNQDQEVQGESTIVCIQTLHLHQCPWKEDNNAFSSSVHLSH